MAVILCTKDGCRLATPEEEAQMGDVHEGRWSRTLDQFRALPEAIRPLVIAMASAIADMPMDESALEYYYQGRARQGLEHAMDALRAVQEFHQAIECEQGRLGE